jgi:hypothetical protein
MTTKLDVYVLPQIQPAVCHGHVLLPVLLGNERLICYVAHVTASWNAAKHVWVHEFA